MIVHTTFTSESTGQHYNAGVYLMQSEYLQLSESDREFVDVPEPPDLEEMGTEFWEDDRFSNDREDSRREQDEEDREGESGKYDAHYGME